MRELKSSGGTEMRDAVLEALRPLRPDAQRQIVLVTDGYVGFEREIVREVLERLPRGSRLHTLGVGSGVNRTFTKSAARAGAGVEVLLGLDEDPERAAARLIARTDRPLVTELELEGEGLLGQAPRRLPDLFAGAPVKIALELSANAREIRVRGKTAGGVWEAKVNVTSMALGEGAQAIPQLYARELVEDREAHLAGGGDPGELEGEIERIGLDFRIATRLTSWIAVSEDRTVDTNRGLVREVMPHEVPYGTSVEAFGLRGGHLISGTVLGEAAAQSFAVPAGALLRQTMNGVPAAMAPSPTRSKRSTPAGVAAVIFFLFLVLLFFWWWLG